MHRRVEEIARQLPHEPGVYIFKDGTGQVLYVGKAADLRKRVVNYLKRGGDGRFLLYFLEEEARDLEFLVTRTEQEALLLENTLIKKFKPKHNIRLKDDKAYLMLRLDPKEDWPWFRFLRRRKKDGALYFGPFSSARSLRRTLRLLHRITPLRDCSDGVFHGRSRPCLKHQIGRCPAPCVGLIDRDAYAALLDRAVGILSGDTRELEKDLEQRMRRASEELQFEQAQTWKDHLEALQLITEKQEVVGTQDRDVIGLFRQEEEAHLSVLSYRNFGLEGSRVHHFKTQLPTAELLDQFLSQLYQGDRYVPREILLPADLAEREGIESWLGSRRDGRVEILLPQRGDKKRAVEMANKNARMAGEIWSRGGDRTEADLEALQRLLHLPNLPRRIHCLDVSTIQGRDTVASRVASLDGQACSAEYRRFSIRGEAGKDDFASMRQAVERSLRLCLEREGEELPDLLLVDGGKGQVAAALDGLAECGLGEELPVAGLAKDRIKGPERRHSGERIFLPGREEPIPLVIDSAPWRILTQLRDEAHRFAITYHRKKRERIGSELDEVEGLGPRRRRALLKHFGSLEGVRQASLQDLSRVPGLPLAVAEKLYRNFQQPPPGPHRASP
jgi:excinuclease ABC subunit C